MYNGALYFKAYNDIYGYGLWRYPPDTSAPVVDTFTANSPSPSLDIAITDFTASDDTGVTGYMITETSTVPAFDAAGWEATVPSTYTVASAGYYTLYPWAKDEAGNVSAVYGSPADVEANIMIYVSSITRTGESPTSNTYVKFLVTFSSSVTGVDVTDFGIESTGLSGAGTSMSVSGAGAKYRVTMYAGMGSGSLKLTLIDDDSILNGSDRPLGGPGLVNGDYTGGASYTINRVPPTVVSILRNGPAETTNAASVSYTVTFSEAVTGVDATDLELWVTGLTGSKISKVSGTGATRTVTVLTGSGAGELILKVLDNDTIKNTAGYKLYGDGYNDAVNGETYSIDRVRPEVGSIRRKDASPTDAPSVDFTVTFTKPVTGVDVSDFKLISGVKVGAAITGITGSDDTYVVTVSTGTKTAANTLRLDLNNNLSIKDIYQNTLAAHFTSGETYAVDKAPQVVSITRADPDPTNAARVRYVVLFSEAVTGVDKTDFRLDATGTLSGASITSVTGSGAKWIVTVNTGTGSGELRLDLIDNDSILDLMSYILGGTGLLNGDFTTGEYYLVR